MNEDPFGSLVSGNSTINLSFRYAEADYVRALRAHYASVLNLRLDVAVIIILAGIGGWIWHFPSLHGWGQFCVGTAVVFGLVLIAAFTVVPPLAFRREPKFRDDYSLSFSPAGIHFRTAHIDSHLQWSMYSRALIDTYSYILYYGSNRFTLIPRRVFASENQREAFEHLLARQVSQIVRRKP
jgi:hypothetical protein